MGGSSSETNVRQEQNTTIVNQNTLNVLNEQINSTIVSQTVENVQSCSAALINNQNLVFKGVKTEGGDITITNIMNQEGMVDFSCVQNQDFHSDITASLVTDIMNTIQNNVDSDIMSQFDSIAENTSDQEFGSLPWGGADSATNVEQIVNNNIENTTNRTLENVIQNSVETNFTYKLFSECIGTVTNNQNFIFENVETGGGAISLTNDISQSAQLLLSCTQGSNISNSITQNMVSALGVEVVDTTTTGTETVLATEATAQAKSAGIGSGISDAAKGIGTGVGTVIGSVGDAVGGLLSIPALGTMAGPSSSISSVICCLSLILIIVFFVMSNKGDEGSEYMENNYER